MLKTRITFYILATLFLLSIGRGEAHPFATNRPLDHRPSSGANFWLQHIARTASRADFSYGNMRQDYGTPPIHGLPWWKVLTTRDHQRIEHTLETLRCSSGLRRLWRTREGNLDSPLINRPCIAMDLYTGPRITLPFPNDRASLPSDRLYLFLHPYNRRYWLMRFRFTRGNYTFDGASTVRLASVRRFLRGMHRLAQRTGHTGTRTTMHDDDPGGP